MVDRRRFLKFSAAGVASLALPGASLGDAATEEVETKFYSDWSAVVPKFWDVRLFSNRKLEVFGFRADKRNPYEWRFPLSDVKSALKRPGVLVTARTILIPVLTRTDTTVRSDLMKIGILPEGAFSTPGYGSRFALIYVPPPHHFVAPGTEYIHRKWLPLEAVQKIVSCSDHESVER